MEIKRTTDIFIETKRRFAVYLPETGEQFFCPQCNEPLIAAEYAAAVFQINCRAVYRFIEAGATHFAETAAGAALVCPAWLESVLLEPVMQPTVEEIPKTQKNLEDEKTQ